MIIRGNTIWLMGIICGNFSQTCIKSMPFVEFSMFLTDTYARFPNDLHSDCNLLVRIVSYFLNHTFNGRLQLKFFLVDVCLRLDSHMVQDDLGIWIDCRTENTLLIYLINKVLQKLYTFNPGHYVVSLISTGELHPNLQELLLYTSLWILNFVISDAHIFQINWFRSLNQYLKQSRYTFEES